MEKKDYALDVLKLAEENNISINWFADITDEFYINLWRLVYDMANNRRKLPIYSFWRTSIMKLPWKTTFIEITIS